MKIKFWIKAMRLRTLPLALSGTMVGSSLAFAQGKFSWAVAVLAALTALSLQILSNLANDLGDFQNGKDTADRIGPERAMQNGWISVKEMKLGLAFWISLSLTFGALLVIFGSNELAVNSTLLFIVLGLAGVVAALKYTMGKNPYGYKAMGDIFVFVFFGLVSVLGTQFLHTHTFEPWHLLPAVAFGFLSSGVLNVNNLRDYKSDKANNKITLVVLIGVKYASMYHAFLVLTALYLLVMYIVVVYSSWTQFVFVLVFPLFFKHLKKILQFNEHEELIPELKNLSLSTFLLAVLYAISLII